jgi:hypothetical protein
MSGSAHPASPDTNGGHEKSDADIGALARFGLGLAVVSAVVLVLMLVMYKFLDQRQKDSQPPRHPLSEASQAPPAPRLQVKPEDDLRKFQVREDSLVNAYGWVMKDAGIVRIPVDRAMELVAQRGLPARGEGEMGEAKGEERRAKSGKQGEQP